MSRAELLRDRVREAIDVCQSLLDDATIAETVDRVVETIVASINVGGKVLLCGNGGSAADAQHLAAELVGRFCLERRPFPAVALADNLAALTAIANDYDYSQVFARAVGALGRPGDVLIGLSTSGRSVNVVKALAAARERGMVTVVLVGAPGSPAEAATDHVLHVRAPSTARIQEGQMLLAHTIFELVERELCQGLSQPGVAFLDRDGTINRKAPDGEYIKRPEEVSLLPGAAPAIRRLNDAGVPVIVVTNQRGVALRQMTEEDLEDVHAELASRLAAEAGARIDGFFHCPHDIAECDCRKPDTGMFKRALEQFPWIDLRQSVTVGDSASDVEAGQALGMKTVQLGFDAADLAAAVDQLLGAPTARS